MSLLAARLTSPLQSFKTRIHSSTSNPIDIKNINFSSSIGGEEIEGEGGGGACKEEARDDGGKDEGGKDEGAEDDGREEYGGGKGENRCGGGKEEDWGNGLEDLRGGGDVEEEGRTGDKEGKEEEEAGGGEEREEEEEGGDWSLLVSEGLDSFSSSTSIRTLLLLFDNGPFSSSFITSSSFFILFSTIFLPFPSIFLLFLFTAALSITCK